MGLEICPVFCGFYKLFLSSALFYLLIFVDIGWGFTQPGILSWAKDHSCGIESPDGYPPLESRTLSFRTRARCLTYASFQSVTIATIVLWKIWVRSWEQFNDNDTVPNVPS